jgi:signal transduction histidine kinase
LILVPSWLRGGSDLRVSKWGINVLTTRIQQRLAVFAAVLTATILLLAWAAQSTWGRVARLNEDLTRGQLESFNIAYQWQVELQHLQGLLLRYELRGDTNDFARFMAGQKQLDAWLDDQRSRVRTPDEQRALAAIDQAYDDYRAAAFRLGQRISAGIPVPMMAADVERTAAEFERLGRLDAELLAAHNHAREAMLDRSRRELGFVRDVLFAALAALLAAGAGLAVIVWRGLIQPLRQQLLESRDLLARQERLASLGFLAAGVAHEIRNPLTAIKARLFTQRRHLPLGSAAADDAMVIGLEIERLEKIVRDFLQFARPADPALRPLMVAEAFADVGQLLGEQLEMRRRIRIATEPSPGMAVMADPAQLKQVLINLIQNAADAIGSDGTITLRAARSRQRLRGEEIRVVMIQVADTGPGIPPEAQSRLFDPFFTTKDNGTGLGLSIAARIVERHGGAIHFDTEHGVGATFGVVLPEADASARPERAPESAAAEKIENDVIATPHIAHRG